MTKQSTATLEERHKTNAFYQLVGNNLLASIMNYTLWFAITFYVYLQTQSVFATGMISGIYLIATASTGFWFGSIVDHHRKKQVMLISSIVSIVAYAVSFLLYITASPDTFKDVSSPTLWLLVVTIMAGVLVGNIRNIALPTLVTLLIPQDKHDKANGLVGTVSGIGFLVTSVISGLLVAHSGLFLALILAVVITLASIVHLWFIDVPEKKIVHLEGQQKIDIKGTFKVVVAIPGLIALILFSTFNNFLGGVYMALMDAYGLSLMSVEAWGFLWGVLSLGFIVGGLIVAKRGLGKNPVRTMLIANLVIWAISSVFTIQASVILLTVGMFVYMCIGPVIEAAEQTIIQKVVPAERQGRVFGFAQSVEQMASPLTAFLMGPITQFVLIPFMTVGAGVELIGGWFGTGASRGIALAFTLTGILGVLVTLLAMASKYYKQLSKSVTQPN